MSRWHRESCSTPMIIIKQRLPTCESCNSSPDLDAIVSAQSAQRLAPSVVPPDEPSGQLNLWWPPCVPYVSKTPAAEVIGDGSSSGSAPKADSLASGMHNSQYASCDYVYSSQMQESQLRLVRLASVDDVDAPVHVNLEIHDDERHPDYETVMEIAHFVDQFTWASTGMFSFKPKTAGRCYDTFGRAEIYEPSGLMPFVLTNGTLANEKNRSQRWD
ncbi:hypothetical protein K456DRAFT_53813 [Colletotrichum gloeosporioides 23]|nr:hypothetical protein K456DRAFT_53813 [Colletotrichum gloeosporioides 23]